MKMPMLGWRVRIACIEVAVNLGSAEDHDRERQLCGLGEQLGWHHITRAAKHRPIGDFLDPFIIQKHGRQELIKNHLTRGK